MAEYGQIWLDMTRCSQILPDMALLGSPALTGGERPADDAVEVEVGADLHLYRPRASDGYFLRVLRGF